eukprot:37934-Rhodomonas_salina.1
MTRDLSVLNIALRTTRDSRQQLAKAQCNLCPDALLTCFHELQDLLYKLVCCQRVCDWRNNVNFLLLVNILHRLVGLALLAHFQQSQILTSSAATVMQTQQQTATTRCT